MPYQQEIRGFVYLISNAPVFLLIAVSESASMSQDVSVANRCGYRKAHASASISRSVGKGHSESFILTLTFPVS